ncbi:MAG: hypothetical protein WD002_03795 [Pseudomonadales bacterium]
MSSFKSIPMWKKIAYSVALVCAVFVLSRIEFTFTLDAGNNHRPTEEASESTEMASRPHCGIVARTRGQIEAYECLAGLEPDQFLEQILTIYVYGFTSGEVDYYLRKLTECRVSTMCPTVLSVHLSTVILKDQPCTECESILLEALSSNDPQIRYFAAGRFAYIGDSSYVDELVNRYERENDHGVLMMLGLSIETLDAERFGKLLKSSASWKSQLFDERAAP